MKSTYIPYWEKNLIAMLAVLLVAAVIAGILCLIKEKNEAANTWKSRTVVFTLLGAVALILPQIGFIITALYLVLGYRSYKAGRVDPGHPAGVIHAAKPALFILGAFAIFIVKSIITSVLNQDSNSSQEEWKYDGADCPYPFHGAEYYTYDASEYYVQK